MKEKIQQYLAELEKEKDIKILLACETGSRAWGFPSPDSDYDVRLIYMHKKDWYLTLDESKDSIELMLENNEIDISGWELRKSLRLLRKSNPPLLERIQSPIQYYVDQEFLETIIVMAKEYYSRIGTIHHYLNMAKKSYSEITENNEYKLKRFFYALRASIACSWVLEKDKIPPIVFSDMLNGLNINNSLRVRINELIQLKSTLSESYYHTGENELFDYMQKCMSDAEIGAKFLPSAQNDKLDLNIFFRKTLAKYDH